MINALAAYRTNIWDNTAEVKTRAVGLAQWEDRAIDIGVRLNQMNTLIRIWPNS